MPDSNSASSKEEKSQTSSQQEKVVSQQAYQQVSTDMHKYKDRNKADSLKISELEAQITAGEEAKMVENKQFQDLYESQKSENEKLRTEQAQDKSNYVDAVKRGALQEELKGVDSKYLIHAKVSDIQLNEDNSINHDSLLLVANEFRKDHSVLIPQGSSGSVTSQAAPVGNTASQIGNIPLEKQSTEQKMLLLKAMKSNN